MNSQAIEHLNKVIYTEKGIKKALERTSQRAMFKNNYNKGYIDAVAEGLKQLEELRSLMESEQDQKFLVKLDSIRQVAK